MTRVRTNGIDIEYQSVGPQDGPPLLLIHGFSQQCIAWPPELVSGLAGAGLRVITFDNRDTGLSQKWDGVVPEFQAVTAAMRSGGTPPVPYTLSDMAADAASLLEVLGIASAHVAGASMGGMIAQLVALEHRSKLRSLIQIFSTTGDVGLPPSSRDAHLALTTPCAAHDRASVIAHVLKSRTAYASTGFPLDDTRAAEFVGRAYDRMYYPEGALRHWGAILTAGPRGERLKSLQLPTLVLHGSADTLLPPEHGRRIAECVAGAEYHEIAGWGHDMPAGVIPILLSYIMPFIERVESAKD